jgi:hypothetical protein
MSSSAQLGSRKTGARWRPLSALAPGAAILASFAASGDVVASVPSASVLVGTVSYADRPEVFLAANVTIHRPGEGVLLKTESDVNGHYEFDSVPTGTYDVDFSFASFQIDRHYGVRAAGGTTTLDGSLSLGMVCECITIPGPPPGSVVSGRLVDSAGRPVAHAGLILEVNGRSALPRNAAPQVYSGIAGEFAVRVPHDAQWVLFVIDDDFETARIDLTPMPYDGKHVVTLTPKALLPRPSSTRRTLKYGLCCFGPFAHDDG